MSGQPKRGRVDDQPNVVVKKRRVAQPSLAAYGSTKLLSLPTPPSLVKVRGDRSYLHKHDSKREQGSSSGAESKDKTALRLRPRQARGGHVHICVPPSQDSELFFVQMADCQLGLYDMNKTWHREVEQLDAVIKQVNAMTTLPAFVIICGDLINCEPEESLGGSGAVIGDNTVNYEQTKALVQSLSRLDARVPLLCLCGNHDVGSIPTRASVQVFRQQWGADFFSFSVGTAEGCKALRIDQMPSLSDKSDIQRNTEFIGLVLNSSLLRQPEKALDYAVEQQAWLSESLRVVHSTRNRGASRPTLMLFTHHPLFTRCPLESCTGFNTPWPIRLQLFRLLNRYPVDAIVSGHYHRTAGGGLCISQVKDQQGASGACISFTQCGVTAQGKTLGGWHSGKKSSEFTTHSECSVVPSAHTRHLCQSCAPASLPDIVFLAHPHECQQCSINCWDLEGWLARAYSEDVKNKDGEKVCHGAECQHAVRAAMKRGDFSVVRDLPKPSDFHIDYECDQVPLWMLPNKRYPFNTYNQAMCPSDCGAGNPSSFLPVRLDPGSHCANKEKKQDSPSDGAGDHTKVSLTEPSSTSSGDSGTGPGHTPDNSGSKVSGDRVSGKVLSSEVVEQIVTNAVGCSFEVNPSLRLFALKRGGWYQHTHCDFDAVSSSNLGQGVAVQKPLLTNKQTVAE